MIDIKPLPKEIKEHIQKQINDYKKKYPHNWYDDNKNNAFKEL